MNTRFTHQKVKQRSKPDTIVSDSYSDTYNAAHVLQTHSFNGNYTESKWSELIAYTNGRRNQYAKSQMCRHVKETFSYSGGRSPLNLALTSPSGWTAEYRGHHANGCNARATVLAAVESSLGTGDGYLAGNGQALINTAFDRLRPDLTTAQIPNFLVDIADMKSLLKLWNKRASLAKNLAGAHLNYKFGWKPTVADIRAMIEVTLRLKDKLTAFEKSLDKTIQSSTTLLSSGDSVSGNVVWPSGNHKAYYNATVARKCTGFIAYRPQPLAVMGSMRKAIYSFLDALGFELNPRILWDALPFTFVIDWFFGVGTWLNRLRLDTLELPILLVDGFLQYKEELSIEWYWVRANDGTYTSIPQSGMSSYRRTLFHRMPIYPDAASLAGLGFKMPTVNQAALLVSLATVLKK
jgi:hypothetical protein